VYWKKERKTKRRSIADFVKNQPANGEPMGKPQIAGRRPRWEHSGKEQVKNERYLPAGNGYSYSLSIRKNVTPPELRRRLVGKRGGGVARGVKKEETKQGHPGPIRHH